VVLEEFKGKNAQDPGEDASLTTPSLEEVTIGRITGVLGD